MKKKRIKYLPKFEKKIKPTKKKKFDKSKVSEHINTKDFLKINTLLDSINIEFENLLDNFHEIYNEFKFRYTKDEFKNFCYQKYFELKTPVLKSIWILHPQKYYSYLIKSGNEERISESLIILAELTNKKGEDIQLENDVIKLSNSIYPDMKNYRKLSSVIIGDAQVKVNNDIKDLYDLIKLFISKIIKFIKINLIESVKELKITSVNILLFYLISIIKFYDVLVDFYELDSKLINIRIIEIEDYAELKRMKRIRELLDTYYSSYNN